jgi:predicted NAD/FAD-binding protein
MAGNGEDGGAAAPAERVAVIGTGIAGMAAAWLISRKAEVTVFEREDRPGGHANTVDVAEDGGPIPVDTGFIVYNQRTYPLFCRLLDELGVATRASDMSFSVRAVGGKVPGFEYCGTGWGGVFAQKRNLLRPWFYRMLIEIARFNRAGNRILRDGSRRDWSLGRHLEAEGHSARFRDYYVLPMGAAIWSTPVSGMLEFPLHAFLRFLSNHGMLGITTHFQWRTIAGGSREYVKKITAPYRDRILCNAAVKSVTRDSNGAAVTLEDGRAFRFDRVVMATHADITLRLLADATERERDLLSLFAYQSNRAVLHGDAGVLPRRPAAHAAWNYEVDQGEPDPAPRLHYLMNRLQGLVSKRPLIVSLNPAPESPLAHVHYEKVYEHPLYGIEAMRRQGEIADLNGVNRTYFCGAWCGYGFHEDGLRSAVEVARHFGIHFGADGADGAA